MKNFNLIFIIFYYFQFCLTNSINECSLKAFNNKCDPECNTYLNGYDGGDCALKFRENPFERCGETAEYCAEKFVNGICDEVFFN